MTYSSEVLADSPLAYYRLGESSGTTMTDSSGNSRNGTYSGTHTVGATGLLTGDANTAVSFAGGTGTVTSAAWMESTSALTIEAWFSTTQTGTRGIAGRWATSGAQVAMIDFDSTTLRFYVKMSGGSTVIASFSHTGYRDGNRHHVVGVFNGSTAKLYIDGIEKASTAAVGVLETGTGRNLTVASRDGSSALTGVVDEVALYGTALSALRVSDHYAVGTGAAGSGSIALSATRQAKTAAFTVATVLAASLAGTLPAKTASFAVSASAQVSLAGTLQAKTAAVTLDLVAPPVRDTTLEGTLQAKSAAFSLLAGADVSLSGSLPAKSAAFTVLTGASVTLAGTLQPKAAAVSLVGVNSVTVAASLRAKTAAFTLTSGKTVSLVGLLRRKTSVITLSAQPVVRLVATMQPKTLAASLDAQPTATFAASLAPKLATFVTYVVAPVTPAPLLAAGHTMVAASAFGAVTMQGSQAVYSISTAYTPRARQRILVDNIDVTYFRGGITPNVTYTLLEPLLYGPATLDIPQVSACFETLGAGELSWLRPGANVEVQRVIDDVVVGTDWKGVIVAFDTSGRSLSVELGGEASGRAAIRDRQPIIFPRVNDLGRQFADSIRDLGLPFYPHLGPVTGIEVQTTGGVGHLEHIQNLVAKAWTRAGRHWTIMPDESTGAYEAHRKDDETIHGTAFTDDARTVANLRRDIAEEHNRIFVTAVTPAGQRIRFGVYPGLIQGPTPAFPGHMEEGDTGDGVRLLIGKLHAMGYLKLKDVEGGYDQDVVDAVTALQIDAGLFDEGFVGTAVPGEVNETTWNHLYDQGTTGNSLEWSNIQPAAQRRKVRPFNRSGTGGIMGFNPDYDPNVLVSDRTIDMGVGFTRGQLREFALTVLHDTNDPNWLGDITFNTGALIRGDGFEGMTVDAGDVMDARELRPGMNLSLPQFDGGTFVHIAAIQVDDEGIVTATVDTRLRDAGPVWETMARNRESANDPARTRNQKRRSSTIVKDSIGEWDEIGGLLGQDIDLVEGWNVFEVVAAMEGTVSRLRIVLDQPDEFACAVFGRSITADRLNNMIPRPLTNYGTKQWETKRDELDERWILYSSGTKAEPCGFWPGRARTVTYDEDTDMETSNVLNDPTGKHFDEAGFAYRSDTRTTLHVAVWVPNDNKLPLGRIMWNQLESAV